ncbi:MAG: DUF2914 domain-containing protein [Myxococcales bacterium]|nr:DUF2914 domain-containing protein [Myxococcales bacterium]MCB9524786.1 DUF2914 domain-containing protein [Myxococcales bacterium]
MRLALLLLLTLAPALAGAAPTVVRMVTAAEVKAREPRGEQAHFPPDDRVFAWAQVDNGAGPPTHLVFVWIHAGREVHRQRVKVSNSPRWRTWSRRWLHPRHAGPWVVRLEAEDGAVLAERAFTVGGERPDVAETQAPARKDPEPEEAEPEDPTPEEAEPEDPEPEDPAPEDPEPEDPAPEAPEPEDPAPEAAPTPAPSDCRALVTFLDGEAQPRTLVLRPGARRPVEAVVPGLAVVDFSGAAHALRVVRTRDTQRAGTGLVDREHDLLWGRPLAGGPPTRWAGFPARLPVAPDEIRAEHNHLTVVSVLGGLVGVHLRLTGRAPEWFDRSRYLTVGAPGRPADPTLGRIPDLPIRTVARLAELTRLTPEVAPDPAKHDFRRAAWALGAAGDLRLFTLMTGPERTFRVDIPVETPAVLEGPDAGGWWRAPCGAVRPGGSALVVRRVGRAPAALAVPGGLKALLGVRWLPARHPWRVAAHEAAWASLAAPDR